MKKTHPATPPNWLLRLFRTFCNPEFVEDIEGDLLERYERESHSGSRKANRKFFFEVVKLMRPSLIKRLLPPLIMNNRMFHNYFITTLRTARKEKAFTLLTLLCLTIGFTAVIYAGLYTRQELSFDTFHEKADRIYRINQTFIWGDIDELFGSTGPAVMNAVQSEIPEFETMTRVLAFDDVVVSVVGSPDQYLFEEGEMRGADSTFFDVFSFPFVKGNPKTALKDPYNVVLTESMALKYFNSIDVLGKQLRIKEPEEEHLYQITGVVKDIPPNSHVTFDLLASLSSLERLKWAKDTWWWTAFVTFGVLREDADPAHVAEKVAQVPGKYLEPFLLKYQGITYAEFIESGETWDLYIQPLLDIHLSSKHVFSRLNETGDIQSIYVFDAIAGLILVLSMINFINLMTARSSRRSKEVGMRKILGTNRGALVTQFLFESVLYCVVAVTLSLGLLSMASPEIDYLTGKTVPLGPLTDPLVIAVIVLVTWITGAFAGLYPAFYLSSVAPLRVIKGQLSQGTRGSLIRSALVTIQFTVSIGLIASALIINKQVQHWFAMDLGFQRNNILVIKHTERLGESIPAFANRIERIPAINRISCSTDSPPYVNHSDGSFYLQGKEEDTRELSYWKGDHEFIPLYGLDIIAGQNFDPLQQNADKAIISRSVASSFGIADPEMAIGKVLSYYEHHVQIIGVFEDIETEIRWKQLPIVLYHYDGTIGSGPYTEISLDWREDLAASQLVDLVHELETEWNEFNTGMPMRFTFLDQEFESIFEPTVRFGQLINFYASLAVLIACLGLVGLVAYVIERRNKEIGIRKVLGASVSRVGMMLTGEFGRLLFIGFALASALSWFAMSRWIQDFDYQTSLSPVTFLIAGCIMLAIVLATLAYQVLRAASSNPVDYLKEE